MSTLAARKCVRHVEREAIARCPSCDGDFCRECIVEHDGRVLCAPCLAKIAVPVAAPRSSTFARRARDVAATALGVMVLWVAFYAGAQFLKLLPPTVHEGTVWKLAVQPP